MLRVKRRAN
uniref:Uncharacterized protein n=1 Tax=Anguilla anguilla TaxID=7936 RepID=A0A0E9TNN3_ANGAN